MGLEMCDIKLWQCASQGIVSLGVVWFFSGFQRSCCRAVQSMMPRQGNQPAKTLPLEAVSQVQF